MSQQNQWAHLSAGRRLHQGLSAPSSDEEDDELPRQDMSGGLSSGSSGASGSSSDNEDDSVLADVPFGELIALKRNGSAHYRPQPADDSHSGEATRARAVQPKRLNKHRPKEVSSKKPVSRFREVVKPTRRKPRDPRFDAMSGTYNEAECAKSYEFLDGYRDIEAAELTKTMKKVKNEERKKALSMEVSRLKSQNNARMQKLKAAERKRDLKRISRSFVQAGHKPYYMKKSELKKVELAAKFAELKQAGGTAKIDRVIEKKRKRNASKLHKFVPRERKKNKLIARALCRLVVEIVTRNLLTHITALITTALLIDSFEMRNLDMETPSRSVHLSVVIPLILASICIERAQLQRA